MSISVDGLAREAQRSVALPFRRHRVQAIARRGARGGVRVRRAKGMAVAHELRIAALALRGNHGGGGGVEEAERRVDAVGARGLGGGAVLRVVGARGLRHVAERPLVGRERRRREGRRRGRRRRAGRRRLRGRRGQARRRRRGRGHLGRRGGRRRRQRGGHRAVARDPVGLARARGRCRGPVGPDHVAHAVGAKGLLVVHARAVGRLRGVVGAYKVRARKGVRLDHVDVLEPAPRLGRRDEVVERLEVGAALGLGHQVGRVERGGAVDARIVVRRVVDRRDRRGRRRGARLQVARAADAGGGGLVAAVPDVVPRVAAPGGRCLHVPGLDRRVHAATIEPDVVAVPRGPAELRVRRGPATVGVVAVVGVRGVVEHRQLRDVVAPRGDARVRRLANVAVPVAPAGGPRARVQRQDMDRDEQRRREGRWVGRGRRGRRSRRRQARAALVRRVGALADAVDPDVVHGGAVLCGARIGVAKVLDVAQNQAFPRRSGAIKQAISLGCGVCSRLESNRVNPEPLRVLHDDAAVGLRELERVAGRRGALALPLLHADPAGRLAVGKPAIRVEPHRVVPRLLVAERKAGHAQMGTARLLGRGALLEAVHARGAVAVAERRTRRRRVGIRRRRWRRGRGRRRRRRAVELVGDVPGGGRPQGYGLGEPKPVQGLEIPRRHVHDRLARAQVRTAVGVVNGLEAVDGSAHRQELVDAVHKGVCAPSSAHVVGDGHVLFDVRPRERARQPGVVDRVVERGRARIAQAGVGHLQHAPGARDLVWIAGQSAVAVDV